MGLRRLLDVRSGESRALGWAFTQCLLLMASLYVVRPLRDEMGIQAGVDNMQWLFSGTFVATAAVVPLWGKATARIDRRRLVPALHAVFALCMVVLCVGEHHADLALRTYVAATIFIWISVFNLIAVSAFWSVLADLFTIEQGRRLFGVVAAGGSLGALIGPLLATVLTASVGPTRLLLVSAVLLAGASASAWRLDRTMRDTQANARALGGSAWGGLGHAARDPILRRVVAYLLLMTWISTILYFAQARIIADALPDPVARTTLFARMDLAVNVMALIVQLGLTARIVRWVGLDGTLMALPLVCVGALACVGLMPTLGVVVGVQVVRRAVSFALAKPGREILFTVVDVHSKYKGKNVVDTLVYRGGDAIAGWGFAALEGLGAALSAISWASVPLAAAWAVLAQRLARLAASRGSARDD